MCSNRARKLLRPNVATNFAKLKLNRRCVIKFYSGTERGEREGEEEKKFICKNSSKKLKTKKKKEEDRERKREKEKEGEGCGMHGIHWWQILKRRA